MLAYFLPFPQLTEQMIGAFPYILENSIQNHCTAQKRQKGGSHSKAGAFFDYTEAV